MREPIITRTKTRVIMPRGAAENFFRRYGLALQLSRRLAQQLEEEQQLLHVALHQLAAERSAPERERFAREWLREHRKFDTEGVPFGKRH